jgi:hemoglobin
MITALPDIGSREDIERLVNTFYDRIRADDLLGPIFDDVARVNWAEHLPKMYAFWDAVLFGTSGFKGNPLGVHLQLAQHTPLGATQFERWLALFQANVDGLFSGPTAGEAKRRAARIAVVLQQHIKEARDLPAPA